MSRIPIPSSILSAPEASRPSLEAVENLLGSVPNLFRIIANSPQTLEGYIGLNNALSKGLLDAQTRERIALAVAEVNACNYCLAAHQYLGSNMAHLSDAEMEANRRGSSGDDKAAVAVDFASKIVCSRGQISDSDFQAVRAAGYSDAEIVEIVGHVALNTLTNYINQVLGTEIDFPSVDEMAA